MYTSRDRSPKRLRFFSRQWAGNVCVFAWLVLVPQVRAQLPDLLYLPFNEGSGATTADMASPGIAGSNPTLSNPMAWNTMAPFAGNAAWGPDPAVANDVVTTGIFHNHVGDLTIEMAVFPGSFPANQQTPRFDLHALQVGNLIPIRVRRKLGFPEIRLFFAGAGLSREVPPPLPQFMWTFVSLVYDSARSEIRTYFDGEIVDTVPVSAALATGSLLQWNVGQSIGGPSCGDWQGSIDEVRVWAGVRSQSLIRAAAKDEIKNLDLAVGDFLSPPRRLARCQYYQNTESVTVDICNPGQTPIAPGSVLPLTLKLDGVTVATEFAVTSQVLNPGESFSFTFAATVDLSRAGRHFLDVSMTFTDDQQQNNELSLDFEGGGPGVVREFPWIEEFDSVPVSNFSFGLSSVLPPGWFNPTNEPGNAGFSATDWVVINIPFPGPNPTGPVFYDRTGSAGGYVIGPATAPNVWLQTPCIELNGVTSPDLVFYASQANYYNQAPASLSIEVTSLTTGMTTPIFGPVFNSGPGDWELHHVDLTPFKNETIFFTLKGMSGVINNILIDDFGIIDQATPLVGQPPQPGLATLDIDRCTNAHGQDVVSGEPGPYRRVSQYYKNIDFTITGSPLMPFVLFSSGLNPVNATFPGIGQLDIGGPIDLLTGVPSNLFTWGNGFAQTMPIDQYFFTDATGEVVLPGELPVVYLTQGRIPFATFQVVVARPVAPYFAISNAVQLVQY